MTSGGLCGERAWQQSGALADLDEVPAWVAYIAADLGFAVDRRCDEFGTLRAPLLVARLDVSDPQVQGDRGGVAGLVVAPRNSWLCGVGRRAGRNRPRRAQAA